jgi:DNA-binding PadR family transcriptional regulator
MLLYGRVLVNNQQTVEMAHHQKTIILGLVAIGKKYGFEIEEFIARNEMKRWAEIGNSTIYKLLKDLEHEGALSGRKVASDKGPTRTEYSLTARGRKQLNEFVLGALKSDTTARLDRISGLFFAPLLPKKVGKAALERTIGQLSEVDKKLHDHLSVQKNDVIAEAIIQFYIDLNHAETRAIEKVLGMFS